MTPRIMVDLETLSAETNAAILEIGAVVFSRQGVTDNNFYVKVDLESAMQHGHVSASTIRWWMEQSNEARAEAFSGGGWMLPEALAQFGDWVRSVAYDGNVEVWGNGAGFDNAILRHAYRAVHNEDTPWPFRYDRCYRTLKSRHPDVQFVREGTHHNALDDAVSQAKHAAAILAKYP
jgi:hypothetical protein